MWIREAVLKDVDSRTQRAIAVAGLVCLGVGLRLYGIGEKDIWLDEAASLEYARRSVGFLLTELPFADPHSPLYYLLLKGWIGVFGVSEASLRFPSLILSALTLPVVYLLAARLFSRRVAFVSLGLMAVNPYHIEYAQEARMYALLAFAGSLSMYLFVRLCMASRPSTTMLVGYLAATVLTGYTHAHGLFVIAVQNTLVVGGYLWARETTVMIPLRRWVGSQVVLVACLSPWLGVLVRRAAASDSPGWLQAPSLLEAVDPLTIYFGYTVERNPLLAVGVASLIVVGLVRWQHTARETGAARDWGISSQPASVLLGVWVIFLVAIPVAVSHLLSPIWHPRYAILASVPLVILVANGLVAISSVRTQLLANQALFLAILLVLQMAVPVAAFHSQEQSGWQDAVATIEREATEDDVVVSIPGYSHKQFQYYATAANDAYRYEAQSATASSTQIRSTVGDADRVILVVNHENMFFTDGRTWRTTLAERYDHAWTDDYDNLSVYVYERSA